MGTGEVIILVGLLGAWFFCMYIRRTRRLAAVVPEIIASDDDFIKQLKVVDKLMPLITDNKSIIMRAARPALAPYRNKELPVKIVDIAIEVIDDNKGFTFILLGTDLTTTLHHNKPHDVTLSWHMNHLIKNSFAYDPVLLNHEDFPNNVSSVAIHFSMAVDGFVDNKYSLFFDKIMVKNKPNFKLQFMRLRG